MRRGAVDKALGYGRHVGAVDLERGNADHAADIGGGLERQIDGTSPDFDPALIGDLAAALGNQEEVARRTLPTDGHADRFCLLADRLGDVQDDTVGARPTQPGEWVGNFGRGVGCRDADGVGFLDIRRKFELSHAKLIRFVGADLQRAVFRLGP